MKKLQKCLKYDGKLIISTPNWGRLYYYETWKDLKEFETFSDEKQYYQNHFIYNYQYSKEELLEIFSLSWLQPIQYSLSSGNKHNFVLEIKQ